MYICRALLKIFIHNIKSISNVEPLIVHTKPVLYDKFLNGRVIVSYTQQMERAVFFYTIKYGCTTFTFRENCINKNTVRTEGIQIPLYFIVSCMYLVQCCCCYENMVHINSIVNVKQKQTYYECDPI